VFNPIPKKAHPHDARHRQPAARWLCGALLAALTTAAAAATDGLATSAEYIVGFVRYIHWKTEDSAETWRICILGAVPLDQERAYAGEIVRGKRFVVRRIEPDDPLGNCHVLDLTATDAALSHAMLLRARPLPVLTVGSGSAFCSDGGQLCLHLDDRDQKFEVNLTAVRDAGLSVSSRLLMIGSGHSARAQER
jgi:hypothetical protein